MKISIIFIYCIIFISLTALTQAGGLIYLFSFITHKYINQRFYNKWLKRLIKFIVFLSLYSIATFLVVPPIAEFFGRTQLPVKQTSNVRPLNFLTCLLNRNYVNPELKATLLNVAEEINKKYPGTIVNYLDANFPFIDGFSLLPHLSHNDGKKLDISFFYIDKKSGTQTNNCPSFTGYGICEEPTRKEVHTTDICVAKGYWQYNFLKRITPQYNKAYFYFDPDRTKAIINLFAAENNVEKIFIEPHLKERMKLNNIKVRFQGCQAVRHDDHIHIQVK